MGEIYHIPAVPAYAAALLAVSFPETRKWDKAKERRVYFEPTGDFNINKKPGAMRIGHILTRPDGEHEVSIDREGVLPSVCFSLGTGRMTRQKMGLCIASRLAGLRIQRDDLNGWTGKLLYPGENTPC